MSPPVRPNSRSRSSGVSTRRPSTLAAKLGAWRFTVAIMRSATSSRTSSHVRPGSAAARSGFACWQNRLATCAPGGASVASTVDGISNSTIGARDHPCVRASKYACSMYASDGAITMPLPWCGIGVRPGRHAKSGSSDSATFMRKVPEPQRYATTRARKSSGRCSGATRCSNSSFGLTLATTRTASITSPEASSTPAARPAFTSTRAMGAAVRSTTPRAAHSAAIACVIAPMPPTA